MKLKLQSASFDTWEQKYQLKDKYGNKIEKDVNDMADRIAKKLSEIEFKDNDYWYEKFYELMSEGYAFPAGRIMSNAGAEKYKPKTSTINCTVSNIIYDNIDSIFENVKEAGGTLVSGAGIGYNFSNLRPDNAYVSGAGAKTSGPISFANIYDNACKTISSAGGRRGAQMLTFNIGHPDVEKVIDAKREDGALRQFNISILITEEFLEHLKNNKPFPLAFPIKKEDYDYKSYNCDLIYRNHEAKESEFGKNDYILNDNRQVLMEVYNYVDPNELFEKIMTSTYEYSDPGFILIDNSNYYNNNKNLGENIYATNPCGEQLLPPSGSCLLGSVNLTRFVKKPFTDSATFDFEKLEEVIRTFSRLLDNVVEISNLPLDSQEREIKYKRRHGMGAFGLGSALAMMTIPYGLIFGSY